MPISQIKWLQFANDVGIYKFKLQYRTHMLNKKLTIVKFNARQAQES